jgi:hypothetical protein
MEGSTIMKRANGFKIAAMVIVGITVVLWAIIVVIGLAGGNTGGLTDLVLLLIAVGLSVLAWKKPLLGGILLSAYEIILALYFFLLPTTIYMVETHLLLMCSPITLSGLLFIEAAWSARKKED